MSEKISIWIIEGFQKAIGGLVKWVISGIINSSYWICLIAALLALILYVAGMKKAGKYISISFILYFILQAVRLGL